MLNKTKKTIPLLTDEKYSGYMDGSVEIPTPKIKIKNIRITSYNEKTKFYSCQADLEYTWNDRLVKDLKLIKYISYSDAPDAVLCVTYFKNILYA